MGIFDHLGPVPVSFPQPVNVHQDNPTPAPRNNYNLSMSKVNLQDLTSGYFGLLVPPNVRWYPESLRIVSTLASFVSPRYVVVELHEGPSAPLSSPIIQDFIGGPCLGPFIEHMTLGPDLLDVDGSHLQTAGHMCTTRHFPAVLYEDTWIIVYLSGPVVGGDSISGRLRYYEISN